MKIADNRALVAEKKQYIIPNTASVSMLADSFVCQLVSVHGLKYGGGESSGGGTPIDPM